MKDHKCSCGKTYLIGNHDAGSEQKGLRMCPDCFYKHEVDSVKHITGYEIGRRLDLHPDVVEYHGADLLCAIQYYFDVLEEVNGPDFINRKDHVFRKFKEAYGKATGQI